MAACRRHPSVLRRALCHAQSPPSVYTKNKTKECVRERLIRDKREKGATKRRSWIKRQRYRRGECISSMHPDQIAQHTLLRVRRNVDLALDGAFLKEFRRHRRRLLRGPDRSPRIPSIHDDEVVNVERLESSLADDDSSRSF